MYISQDCEYRLYQSIYNIYFVNLYIKKYMYMYVHVCTCMYMHVTLYLFKLSMYIYIYYNKKKCIIIF